ncbi:MAG TPA: amidohydrolase [Firmicutes bacterium]|nr:amidohydrolase [Bacillota bacterium]
MALGNGHPVDSPVPFGDPAGGKLPVDYLIAGSMVLTLDPQGTAYRDGAVATRGDVILAVGPAREIEARVAPRRRIDGSGKLVIPGLINAHSHMAMAPMRGITHDVPGVIYSIMWPVEASLREEDIYDLAMLGVVESLRAGTTCLVDHYFFMEEIARACQDAGIRAVLGHTVMSSDGPFTGEDQLRAAFDFVERWHGRSPLITPWFAPHAPDTVRPEWLREMAAASGRSGAGIHLHLAQTEREVEVVRSRYGRTPVEQLAECGILGPSTLAAHCIYLTESDIDLLAQSGTTAVFCPTVHANTGKVCRAAHLMRRGVRVGLGSDCASNNDDMNMLEEIRMAVAVQNTIEGHPGALTAGQALRMATTVNAAAIGQADRLGSIKPGYQADLVLLDIRKARWTPLINAEANLVYCGSESDIEMVFVAGVLVVENGRVTTVEEDEVVRRGAAACQRIFDRAGRAMPRFRNLPATVFADGPQGVFSTDFF